eukprot:TRINITY_DN14597_c0_g1_i1.p2 TRINITY_DN14597_c0_g1~~TRINITY_DN14597_c0_g1_i1.p2  ORF type:complete len:106 (+),score=24.05 TRINITY_DN14597_c0_g1_i1:636-953(+)
MAIAALNHLQNKKMKAKLLSFFLYYIFYAAIQITRCVIIIYNIFHPSDPSNPHVLWSVLIVDDITNAILTMVIVLFLKDFRLQSKEERTTKSDGKSISRSKQTNL